MELIQVGRNTYYIKKIIAKMTNLFYNYFSNIQ